jgi:putative CocE/NonD family hydrolase
MKAMIPFLVLLLAAPAQSEPVKQASQPTYGVVRDTKLPVPMRDGVNLGATVYRPDAPGTFPALMVLRYFRGPHQDAWGDYYAKRGYAVALIDSRGRGDSQGKWVTAVNEPKDGFDAQDWLGTRPWCNGKIGTMDISYNGFTQLMPAPFANKHLRCLIPLECQQTNFGHIYNDGVMQLNVVFQYGLHTQGKSDTAKIYDSADAFYRQLPLISVVDKYPNVEHVKDWINHARYDDYWQSYGIKEKYGQIKVPAYFVTGWYDNLVHEGFRNFKGFREQAGSPKARRGTKLLVGPWVHGGSLGYDKLNELQLRWFDHWLKDAPNGITDEPPIRIYVMGKGEWRDENEWPLARTKYVDFKLFSNGKANGVDGEGKLIAGRLPTAPNPPDRFTYDPENPVPTLGGQISTLNPGPFDRSSVQKRLDVLVYTTEPLKEDTEVTGEVVLKLFAASSAVDTDFTATLTDVHPDGKAVHICEGIRGVTFRESLEHPTPIEPGKVYEYSISLWETSQLFRAGHRIRLEVSSSNFPRYARNQNTGLPFGTSAEIKTADQTIFHDADRPSRLILPIIPAEKR